MSSIPWIIIIVAVLIVVLAIVAVFQLRHGKKRPIDYYNLFIMGVIWFVIGLPFDNSALWMLGVVFMIAGLTHKKDWKKNRRTWKDYNKKEMKTLIWLMVAGLVLVLMGIIVFYLVQNKII